MEKRVQACIERLHGLYTRTDWTNATNSRELIVEMVCQVLDTMDSAGNGTRAQHVRDLYASAYAHFDAQRMDEWQLGMILAREQVLADLRDLDATNAELSVLHDTAAPNPMAFWEDFDDNLRQMLQGADSISDDCADLVFLH